MNEACEVYFNPACSKCRELRALLEERGVNASYREYLVTSPSRDELVELMALLRIDHPREMMRTSDPLFGELGLATASHDALLDALVAHPRLIERPIVIMGSRAVIARPPARVEELLD
ncbi:MAG TPA: arsenate reductase (glutaredoxin) [Labilithrix sp.]|nr:arsenate reductase (glutaredoxin) [Labilithrix sp.]